MSIKLAQILQDYFSHQYVWPRKKHLGKSKKGGNRLTLIYTVTEKSLCAGFSLIITFEPK